MEIETPEEIKEFKDNYVYLDKYISDIAGLKRVLEFDFDQLKTRYHGDDASFGQLEKFRNS